MAGDRPVQLLKALQPQFINKLLDDIPFVLEKGSVSSISASIPWAKLLTADISLKIQGLQLCLRPVKNKPRSHKGKYQVYCNDTINKLNSFLLV